MFSAWWAGNNALYEQLPSPLLENLPSFGHQFCQLSSKSLSWEVNGVGGHAFDIMNLLQLFAKEERRKN